MVPHAGLEMEGVNFHSSSQARTPLEHQFASVALVKFGADPTPLLEHFTVSRLLDTLLYPYRTATQEVMHTVIQCREAGVSIAGVRLDGEFGRDQVVTEGHDTQIPVLVRAQRNMGVEAERVPPERCPLSAELG
ncbi:hypothetical protein E7T06_08310 [Deinococcus sp. Arct2-2]|uniref:hypothetical protein n=1 Tax=Deinococcus sp. Arct2-2 TaxID=2568653 RepID=UPI0010A4C8BF|nr:hypothetical protein [Deinococcus sp. Arct2-2]THF70179.1 hypothetical protein E7T06_08310 [Deinococcus sp. Arct2-2]